MTPPPIICRCGEVLVYEPAHPPEPDVGVGAWRGGFECACGWKCENEPVTNDTTD